MNFERRKDPFGAIGIGTRALIEKWLLEIADIESDYIINDDLTIDYSGGDVFLGHSELKEFPDYIQFGEIVNGGFFCNDNQLITLRGGPRSVRHTFCCIDNKLISLKGCPKYVCGDFYCDKKFTVKDVKELCVVEGKIKIWP
jgi:hypothetical protein